MKLLDVAVLSLNSLRRRKLRSWLTVLGIVIAVASIIVLISLANGVNQQITSRLSTMGTDIIQITPGGMRAGRIGGVGVPFVGGGGGPGGGEFGGFGGGRASSEPVLTFKDAEDIRRIDGVLVADARIQGRLRASLKNLNTSLQIVGVDPTAFKAINLAPVVEGKLLNPSDRYSIVLGYSVWHNTFTGEELLNRQINISGYSFRVVGLLNQSTGSFGTSDNAVYMPIDVAKIVLNETTNVNPIIVKVQPGRTADAVALIIEQQLLELHRVTIDKEDFTITTASASQSMASDITGTLTMFLAGIAAISLLVGAIGVANTMFMSVLERTKEIGVLKALGMKDSEITAAFLIEATAIGITGGALGIILSFAISFLLSFFSIASVITPDLVVGSLLFSAIIGILSGAVPARNAAKLQPVEALRYE